MVSDKILAVKDRVRELVRNRPGYRSIAVSRDADGADQIRIDVEATADLEAFDDVVGLRDGIAVVVRRVSGRLQAGRLVAG